MIESLVREALPIRYIPSSIDTENIKCSDNLRMPTELDCISTLGVHGMQCRSMHYDMFQIGSGFYKKEDKELIEYKKEIEVSLTNICKSEEYAFLYGIDQTSIGIDATKTIRKGLPEAIEEFNPTHIITYRQTNEKESAWEDLDLEGIKVLRSNYVDKSIHYLYKADNNFGEFVISQDITLEEYPLTKYQMIGKRGKEYNELTKDNTFVDIHEWVCIEIHEPNEFVQVIDRRY